jgi:hypothetical protein
VEVGSGQLGLVKRLGHHGGHFENTGINHDADGGGDRTRPTQPVIP